MKYLVVLSLVLTGCTDGIPLQNVDYSSLLTDDNSKVWLINKQSVDKVNFASGHNWNKDLMIFYASGKVEIIPMKAMGKSFPKIGEYYLNSDSKRLEISFPDEEWKMDLKYITEDSIYMKSVKGSDTRFDIQIIPLPELGKGR
ncbi:MAG: hypothetical protein HRT57_08840 [Crocinitomicaceae bacterium]|nr:hypothetical protein [Crocinitomicaceae bacterium]